MVSHPSLTNLAQLRFRNPDSFQAGSLHDHVHFWENFISSTRYSCPRVSLLQIIRERVKVYDFFQHFKGNFKGRRYDAAVPSCKLYVREVLKAISTVTKNSQLAVPIRGPLRQELQEWAFLDNWFGLLPWRSEHHLSVTLFTDASQKAWGAVLVRDGASQQIHDYWLDHERDINVLEARVLYNALGSFFPSIRNARIDVWTDNVTLQAAWENGGCRSSLVNQEMKRVEECLALEILLYT